MLQGKKDKPVVFVGTQTTGLVPAFHEVIEVVMMSEQEGKVLMHRKMLPYYEDRMSEEARRANGYQREAWTSAPEFQAGWRETIVEMQQLFYGTIMVSFNAAFQWSMLLPYFHRYDQRPPQCYHIPVDLQVLGLSKEGQFYPSIFKLCSAFRVEYSPDWELLRKVQAAREVYCKMMS